MLFRWTGRTRPLHERAMLMPLALLAWLLPAHALAATISHVGVEKGRIVIRFDEAVERAASFVLDGPRRIAVDVNGVGPGTEATAAGPVSAVRQGARKGGTRIVFDLAEPAIVAEGRLGEDGRELTLKLREVDAARFSRASLTGPLSFIPGLGSRAPKYKVTQAVPPARRAKLPAVRGEDGRPLVVIDAGHGGVDPAMPGVDHHQRAAVLAAHGGQLGAPGRRDRLRDLVLGRARAEAGDEGQRPRQAGAAEARGVDLAQLQRQLAAVLAQPAFGHDRGLGKVEHDARAALARTLAHRRDRAGGGRLRARAHAVHVHRDPARAVQNEAGGALHRLVEADHDAALLHADMRDRGGKGVGGQEPRQQGQRHQHGAFMKRTRPPGPAK